MEHNSEEDVTPGSVHINIRMCALHTEMGARRDVETLGTVGYYIHGTVRVCRGDGSVMTGSVRPGTINGSGNRLELQ